MATLKQLNQILEESSSLKYIAQAYTEISAAKLNKIRGGIERNRLFAEEIIKVLHVVEEAAAKKRIIAPGKDKGTISLLVTSNYRFYGTLENSLTRYFMVNTAKTKTDRVVVGKTGENYLQSVNYFHPHQTITFATDLPTPEELGRLTSLISGYKQVLIYHSRMQSVLIQKPTVTDLTQRPAVETGSEELTLDYIFEPEIGKVLQFFETQITLLLLEYTFLESELARTAAKMISMDEAQVNADKRIKEQKQSITRAKRAQTNIGLLETAASLMSWKRGKHRI